MVHATGKPANPFWVIGTVLFVWSGAFALRGSYLIPPERYPCLIDDSLISLSYARNLVAGFGLSWSRTGQRVEGFSHPLWLALEVPLAWFFRDPRGLAWMLVLLGITTVLWALFESDQLVTALGGSARARWMVLAVLSGHISFLSWALLGMETALAAALLLRLVRRATELVGAPSVKRENELIALGSALGFLRLDLFPAWIGVLATLSGCKPRFLRYSLLFHGLVSSCPLVLWQGFRLIYFGDWLPNTYALKLLQIDLGVRLARGAATSLPFLGAHLGLILLAKVALKNRGIRSVVLLLGVPAFYLLYSIWVGGDTWDTWIPHLTANRFQALAVPFLAVLGALGFERVDQSSSRFNAKRIPLALLAAVTSWWGLLPAVWWEGLKRSLLLERPEFCTGLETHHRHLKRVETAFPEKVRVAVWWAGVAGLYTNWQLEDLYGYNDREIARMTPSPPLTLRKWQDFVPGHAKVGFEIVLSRRPDLFLEVPADRPDLVPLLKGAGYWRHPTGAYVSPDLVPSRPEALKKPFANKTGFRVERCAPEP